MAKYGILSFCSTSSRNVSIITVIINNVLTVKRTWKGNPLLWCAIPNGASFNINEVIFIHLHYFYVYLLRQKFVTFIQLLKCDKANNKFLFINNSWFINVAERLKCCCDIIDCRLQKEKPAMNKLSLLPYDWGTRIINSIIPLWILRIISRATSAHRKCSDNFGS